MERKVVIPPITSLRMRAMVRESDQRSAIRLPSPLIADRRSLIASLRLNRDVVDDALHAVHAVRGVADLAAVFLGLRMAAEGDDGVMHVDLDGERLLGHRRRDLDRKRTR